MSPDTAVLAHYLAPLRPHLARPEVTELVVNRPGEIGLEGPTGWTWVEVPELTDAWLRPLAVAAAARTRQDVSEAHPICSTVLPDGERCQVVLPPAAERLSLTIRKPSARTLALADLAGAGLFEGLRATPGDTQDLDAELAARRAQGDWPGFFRAAVAGRRNILISGATGSGKTTFAKALARLIPAEERLITVEDARELTVPHRNAVHLLYAKDGQGLARVDVKALLESALRMRPDRILLQELRDAAAYVYLRNVNSGHPGSITTIHADSAALAFEQLTLLVKESPAGQGLSRAEIGALLRPLVDIVVHLRREAGRFRIAEVWHEPHRRHALAA